MKYGIMGGTFSPVHIGHLILAEEVCETYGLDQVFFVPSGRPPHKEQSASGADRLKMVELAIRGNRRFQVLDLEIRKKSYSYTVETVRDLKKMYPDDVFYFITGADALTSLDTWHSFRELAKSITFIGANRPGVSELGVRQKVESLRAVHGFQIEQVEIPSISISSSDIRRRVNLGKSVKYMVPAKVEEYILKKNLYVEHHELYGKMDKMTKARLSAKRYLHSVGVAAAARRLAVRYGEDYRKAELAGLIHDFCKEIGKEEAWKSVQKYGIKEYECIRQNPVLAHGEIAAAYLKDQGSVTDDEVLDAVRWHTYGHPEMSNLAKIVYVADIIEDGRPPFDGQEEVRIASEESIDAAIAAWQKYDEARIYGYPHHPNAAEMFRNVRKNLEMKQNNSDKQK